MVNGAFIKGLTFRLVELFSSTLFLPLRPRWWGGRTFIEDSTNSLRGHCFLPFSHHPTGGGLSLRDEHFYNGSLILYAHSPSLAGGGAFIEGDS